MVVWIDNTLSWVDNGDYWLGIIADINIPVAINTANGVFTEYWMYPPFYILNEDGDYLHLISFEDVYPGRPTLTQTLTVKNELPANVTLEITGNSVSGSGDSDKDTVDATYLSLDDTDYSHTLSLPVDANDTANFYLYYRPPSTAKIGNKRWDLGLSYTANAFGWWSYINMFDVTSTSTTDQTDVIISITIPYTAGKMETDFSDIRFYHYNFQLEYSIYYKVDSTSATFLVKIPTLYAGEVKSIWILSGNNSIDYYDYDVYTEGWNWEDTTLDPWEQTDGSVQSSVTAYNDSTWGHYCMRAHCYGSYTTTKAESEATGAYGRWVMRYRFSHDDNGQARYYFMHDGTHSYSLYFNENGGTITLYKDGTSIGSSALTYNTSTHLLIIDRDTDGNFSVSIDGVEKITATDNTITTSIKEEISFYSVGWHRYWYIDYIHFIEESTTPPTVGSLDDWYDLAYGIGCMGKVGYDVQDLPEIQNQLRYGIRIDGELYE